MTKVRKDKIFDSLPQSVKDAIIEHEENSKNSVIKKKINEAILIDPSKENDASQNYDEKGRPIKDE